MTSYGALTLDVPKDFEDETVVVLKAPAPSPGVRMRAPTGEVRRPTLIVRRVPLTSDATLDELIEAEERVLQLTVPGLQLLERSGRTVAGHAAVTRELVMSVPDGKMRQLHVALVANRAFWMFVGAALDDVNFPRAVFLAVIDSATFG